jgi:hypothetical protein
MDTIWQSILGFFSNLIGSLAGWLESTIQLDSRILGFYEDIIVPIPEVFKLLGALLFVVIMIMGTFTFIKKLLKLFIVIAVIIVIVLAISQ